MLARRSRSSRNPVPSAETYSGLKKPRAKDTHMNRLARHRAVLGIVGLLIVGTAHAQALLDQITLVPDATVAANPVKAPQPFTITTAGSYTATLTDLQQPSALGSLSVAITTANGPVQTLSLPTQNGTVSSPMQSMNFTLQPGSYFAQVIVN